MSRWMKISVMALIAVVVVVLHLIAITYAGSEISGIVTDRETGEPLSGVTVKNESGQSVTTGQDGTFKISTRGSVLQTRRIKFVLEPDYDDAEIVVEVPLFGWTEQTVSVSMEKLTF
ncbi:MAG: hypothetical protein ACE5OY_06775 [Candidatus Bathyarchaeia archaeon]